MAVSTRNDDGVMTITLGTQFDFDCVDEFRHAYSGSKARSYIVDFRNTEYMDSTGLGMLLNMRRYLDEGAIPIRLDNCRPQVRKVLLISRFETKFDIA